MKQLPWWKSQKTSYNNNYSNKHFPGDFIVALTFDTLPMIFLNVSSVFSFYFLLSLLLFPFVVSLPNSAFLLFLHLFVAFFYLFNDYSLSLSLYIIFFDGSICFSSSFNLQSFFLLSLPFVFIRLIRRNSGGLKILTAWQTLRILNHNRSPRQRDR